MAPRCNHPSNYCVAPGWLASAASAQCGGRVHHVVCTGCVGMLKAASFAAACAQTTARVMMCRDIDAAVGGCALLSVTKPVLEQPAEQKQNMYNVCEDDTR